MKLLVAGATGVAGSAFMSLVHEAMPDTVVRGTYLTNPPEATGPNTEYVKADLTDREGCLMAARGCDAAVLLAAVTGGAKSTMDAPYRQTTNNLVMDALLLQALYEQGVKKVIYVSTATIYQEFDGAIHEDDLDLNLDPHGTYFGVGWAKRSAEKLCQFWRDVMGMDIKVLRAANIYGPRAAFDPDRSNFIPALIRKAVDKMDPFEVWGSPHVTRDVIYASDFARGVLAVLNAKTDEQTFNIASGETVTVGEVVDFALKAAGHKPGEVKYIGDAPQTIQHRRLDISRIQAETGWKPCVTPEEGIRKTSEWWNANKKTWKK
ncbi:NAD-dependent epimerase/dehydratase family protein [Pseudodesulfovibrio sediminis]|uniref:GDP-L-fucose synthase n=1 Tax=Pseudodesulfovibrio sediminis TaxID=2810563 RepID=A0ABM7P3S5_9BACT|nr:NAD-dependent epimerase/dehydratase family protein [Pseudodesulfovibrio sediminis]BCS87511.1 GDP-L-fucose synthase [Pseudodesulfovibrio sediminis]